MLPKLDIITGKPTSTLVNKLISLLKENNYLAAVFEEHLFILTSSEMQEKKTE